MPQSTQDPQSGFNEAFPKVVQTIRAASALAAQDVKFYASLDHTLAEAFETSAASILSLANSLLLKSSNDFRPIESGLDYLTSSLNWKNVSDALDNTFENIDLAMDVLQNPKKDDSLLYLDEGSREDETPKVIVKPQLSFKTPIDNSDSHPFQPKLKSKPHALRSLEESVKLVLPEPNDDGNVDPPHHAHPYEYEIMHQEVPEIAITRKAPIPSTEWSSTEAIWVDSVAELNKMVDTLKQLTEIAVDLEHHDYRSYYGLTCLMQISDRSQDWVVDTLALWDDLQVLNEVFANPNIIKVFHGAFMDIIWLQRDLGLYVVSLFDTYHASKKLGLPKFSLAYLLETYAKFKTSKKYQLADWRTRPLSPAMMQYARADTHFLLNIFDQLKNELISSGGQKLQEVLFESRKVANRRFEYNKFKPLTSDSHSFGSSDWGQDSGKWIMRQYNIPLNRLPLIGTLILWRDNMARMNDESVRFTMPNQVLVNLATLSLPVNADKVLGVSRYLSQAVRVNAKELAESIAELIAGIDDDKLEETMTMANAIATEGEVDYSVANSISSDFDLIVQLRQDTADKRESSLIDNGSCLFSNILSERAGQFSVLFDDKLKLMKEITSKVLHLRIKLLSEKLQPLPVPVLENLPVEQGLNDNTKSGPIQASRDDSPSEDENGDDFNVNEVVTLTKKKHRKVVNVDNASSSEPIFDYSASENANILKSDVPTPRNKKRSYDPFGVSKNTGPQPAKKNKGFNFGKSTSFTKRRS